MGSLEEGSWLTLKTEWQQLAGRQLGRLSSSPAKPRVWPWIEVPHSLSKKAGNKEACRESLARAKATPFPGLHEPSPWQQAETERTCSPGHLSSVTAPRDLAHF